MKIRFEYSIILFFMGFLLTKNHAAAIAVIICAFIHECGHLICAKALKIEIREMVIDIGGAKIYPSSNTYPYANELLMASSGPLANLACCILIKLLFGDKLYAKMPINVEKADFESFIFLIFVFSLIQAFLNLIPISTLDGGRMLRCVLCIIFSERAGRVGVKLTTFIFALILWIISVYFLLGNGGGISLFVFSICMFFKIFEC